MSKGCAESAGNTSDDNPDPESSRKMRGQAARKGGRERGSKDEETWSPTRREAGDGRSDTLLPKPEAIRPPERSVGTHFLLGA